MPDIDLSLYYTSEEAAQALSKKSGKPISPAYVRMLVRYGKISQVKIRERFSVYPRVEVDNYKVEARGVRSAAAAKAKAKKKKEDEPCEACHQKLQATMKKALHRNEKSQETTG